MEQLPAVPASPGDPAWTQRLLAVYQQAVGHELPNQLVALQGTARMLEQEHDEQLSPELRAGLRHLAEMAQRVHALVGTLADVGRACRKAEPPAPVDLEGLCSEAAAEVNWLYPGRDVRYDIQQPLPAVTLPPSAARRVLVELFLHAVRRAPAGLPLRVEVSAAASPAGVEVRIKDNSPLLSPARLRQVFDPFAGSAGQEPSFGPFLARQLVEAWGGTLRVESEQGAGCAWVVCCPLSVVRCPSSVVGGREAEVSG